MANSDKNILITPNTGSTTLNPTIRFTGANNTPLTLRTLDTGTISFEGTAGQLFSISDGLTGTIFSVNDISGIPSIEVLDTGLIKLGQYNGQTVIGGASPVSTAELTVYPSAAASLGLVVKGFASQTANLQEWQNSAGAILAYISNSGALISQGTIGTAGYIYSTLPASFGSNGLNNTYQVQVINGAAARIGLMVQGAASQSANLQEWQNSSGTILANVSSSGGFTVPSLTVSGDLTVNGTTTNINSTNLVVEDKNIVLGDTATPTDTTADGGGITLKGTTDKTFIWEEIIQSFSSSENLNLASGKSYYVNGTALKDVSETLTNKTITSPTITGSVSLDNAGDLAINSSDHIILTPGSGKSVKWGTDIVQIRVANVTDTEIGYLNGVTSNIQTQIDNVATIQGTQGIQGIQGTQGITGTQGVQGVFNVSDTQPTPPYPGQVWVNATDGRTYVYDDTEWFEAYGNLQGIQGPTGAQGIQGPSIEALYDTEQSVISGQVFS